MTDLIIPLRPPDWSDAHAGPHHPGLRTARAAYVQAMGDMPGWAKAALALRNRVVALFGLKTESDDGGGLMTGLPVRDEAPERFECGLTDRHLTFTIRTELLAGSVKMTTSIWFEHWLGRVYLAIVLIPHKLIVRQTIQRLARPAP